MTIIILLIAVFSFALCLCLLVKQLLPKDKPVAQSLKDVKQKGSQKVEAVSQQGKQYVEMAGATLTVAEALISILKLPPVWTVKINKMLGKAQQNIKKAEELTSHPDIFSLLAMISPATSQIYGDPGENCAYILSEDKDNPFQINEAIMTAAKQIVAGQTTELGKARALFDWGVQNIPIGTSGWKRRKKSMRTAVEIFEDREGVCAEMTILYIVMARSVGLQANYARIEEIDSSGKVSKHASPVLNIDGKYLYADIGFKQFDAKHQGYTIMTDQEAVPHFKKLRGN